MARNQAKTELLGQYSQYKISIEQGKSLSDAAARAVPKGEICAFRQAGLKSIEPALRAKGFGIIEKSRIAVHDPLRHDASSAFLKIVTSKTKRRSPAAT